VTKIVNALNIRVPPRELKSKDTRNLLTLIMQQWLPLSTATFQAIVDVIPPPSSAQAVRLPFMLHPQRAVASPTPLEPLNTLERGLYSCDQSENAPVVAYVSKMFAVSRGELPEFRRKELTAEEMRQKGREERERRAAEAAKVSNGVPMDGVEGLTTSLESVNLESHTNGNDVANGETSEVLLGFSRIFSGILRRDTPLIATLPKYVPELGMSHPRNAKHLVRARVRDLYVMMGRGLVAVDEVPAGHVCAIGGLDGVVPRNATLWAPSVAGVHDEVNEGLINLAGVSMQVRATLCMGYEADHFSPHRSSESRLSPNTRATCRSSFTDSRFSIKPIHVPSI